MKEDLRGIQHPFVVMCALLLEAFAHLLQLWGRNLPAAFQVSSSGDSMKTKEDFPGIQHPFVVMCTLLGEAFAQLLVPGIQHPLVLMCALLLEAFAQPLV